MKRNEKKIIRISEKAIKSGARSACCSAQYRGAVFRLHLNSVRLAVLCAISLLFTTNNNQLQQKAIALKIQSNINQSNSLHFILFCNSSFHFARFAYARMHNPLVFHVLNFFICLRLQLYFLRFGICGNMQRCGCVLYRGTHVGRRK